MDEFESHLSDEMSQVGASVNASAGLHDAVRRRVHRRQSIAGAIAALPVVLLIGGAFWIVNLDDGDDASITDTLVDPAPEPQADALTTALVELGVDLATAPTEVTALGDRVFCGIEVLDGSTLYGDVHSCWTDAHEVNAEPVLVRSYETVEGAPVVDVWSGATTARTTSWVDGTRDALGSQNWQQYECGPVQTPSGVPWLLLPDCTPVNEIVDEDPLLVALVELGVDLDTAPPDAIVLGDVDWCGVDNVFDDPNLHARRCLWDAWHAQRPAAYVAHMTTIEGGQLVEVQFMDPAGYVVRWVDATRDDFGSGQWSQWFCTEFDGTEEEPIGANDCNNSRPDAPDGTAESADDPAEKNPPPPDPVAEIALAPGESLSFDLPAISWDANFGTTRALFLRARLSKNPSGLVAFAAAGIATLNSDGGITVDLEVPQIIGVPEFSEFGSVELQPIQPEIYNLTADETILTSVEVTAIGTFEPAAAPSVEVANALLKSTGLGTVPFGTSRADALAALEADFGRTAIYTEKVGCLTTGYADLGEGLIVEFWGDDAGAQSGFVAWFYGFEMGPQGFPIAPVSSPFDSSLTTESGIGIGTAMAEILATGGGAKTTYDGGSFAPLWFSADNVAGDLTDDATSPFAVVRTITSGVYGAPATSVC
ncbi:MAG: hypothetical protein ACI9C1_001327 [Candidatus Aldehydirespiratoraceae bacterium]|jgi:hypothetical protein